MPTDIPIGKALRNVRLDRHLSQNQLAKRMGVPRPYLTKAENGYVTPTIAQLERFSCSLEIGLGRLIHYAELLRVGQMIPDAVFSANGKQRPVPMIPPMPTRAPEATRG